MNGKERRRYEHVPFSTSLTIIDLASQRRYEGRSIDLSMGGIGFYCERFFQTGAGIAVLAQIGRPGGDRLTPIHATVRWARVEGDGAVMGAEFGEPLSPASQPRLCQCICEK